MFDKFHEECGIFGGYTFSSDIAPIIQKGLFKLQHRGQESAGVCCGFNTQTLLKAKGLVSEALPNHKIKDIEGRFGIGHVRYCAEKEINSINAQPYLINYLGEDVSIAHNGNVKKAMKIRQKFEQIGEVFITNSDSEVILKRIIYGLKKPASKWSFEEVGNCLKEDFSKGAFSLVFYLPNRVLAYRDPVGYRPLVFCVAKEGFFVASEDVAFNGLEIQKIIEIEAGYGVEITSEGYTIKQFCEVKKEKKCVFEHIYFANPASNIFHKNVYQARVELGKTLARFDDIKADIVVPVMDSGFACAIGYSKESGIPLEMGLLRNHWIGRSFIAPTQNSRIQKVRDKLTPIKPVVEGKSVILTDDSLVRGTTSKEIIKMLRGVGVREIHFRLASPMILNTCEWGVDIPTKEELIATTCKCEEEIAEKIGADSVKFLPFKGLKEIFDDGAWCFKCFKLNKDKTEEECLLKGGYNV